MFENEEDYKSHLTDCLKIAMVSYNIQSIQLSKYIEEKINKEKKKRIEYIYANKISDLYKYRENKIKEDQTKGLLNKEWMINVMNFIPSILIIHYQIEIGSNKELEERNIYQELEEVRTYSNSIMIIFILITKDIQENPYNLNFDDKIKPYCLKNFINKNDFYIFQVEEIWKTNEFMKICNKIYKSSRDFYRKYKLKYKNLREKTKIREERIEYDIKLGILYQIKSHPNKKNKSKYFKEAYDLLSDKKFNIANYKYGNKPLNTKNNFYEIRAVADWLFFKFPTLQNGLFHELIKIYKRHIYNFSNIKYYDKQNKDYFHFVEYYWLYQRYKNLSESIDNIINNGKVRNKNNLITFGMILFKQVYFLIKMIKFYEIYFNDTKFDLNSVLINGKKFNINDIEEEKKLFFGKPPSYFIIDKENNNNKIILDLNLNDEIFIRKFIINNKININDMIDMLKNTHFNQIALFFSKIKSEDIKNNKNNNNNNIEMKGISLYINILRIISINSKENKKFFEIPEISSAIINIHKIILNSFQIKKFTKVYIYFLRQYINLIQFQMKEEKDKNSSNNKINYYKTELFINLSLLGNITKLEYEEENIFYDILNDIEFIPIKETENNNNNNKIIVNLMYYNKNNIGIINCNNLSFNFDYSIKDINKYQEIKIFDLIEYEIKFNSTLSKEKIKFNSLKLYFNCIIEDNKKNIKNTEIIKEYNKEELDKYELGLESNIFISYKLLLKFKKGRINLYKVELTLCKKENIYYIINIPKIKDKTIILSGKNNNILNFKFPQKLTSVGINQFFKFNYEVNKQDINYIKITDYKISLEGSNINNSQKNSSKNTQNENNNKIIHNIDDYIELNDNNNWTRKKVSGSLHIPNKQVNNTESSLILFMFKNSNERHKSFHKKKSKLDPPKPPIFYSFDEKNNNIIKQENFFEIQYNNFESRLEEGKNKFDILIKFSEYGLFKIKLKIKYFIQHIEIGDIMEFNKEIIFYYKVIDPLRLTNKITSENYVYEKDKNKKNEKLKEYLTETIIKTNLIFNNLLEEDIIIKDIKINLNNILSFKNKIQINTTIKEIVDNKDIEEEIKEEILKIFHASNYSIPFDIKFYCPFYGSIGKCQIIWTTNSLKEFQKDKNEKFLNMNEYEFPNFNVNLIELKYNYEKIIKDNKIILNIKINNNSNYNKNLFIRVEKNDEYGYIISGSLKQKVYLKSNEGIKFSLKLIVLQIGELKLPDIMIQELDYNGKELLTNFYSPEKILFK